MDNSKKNQEPLSNLMQLNSKLTQSKKARQPLILKTMQVKNLELKMKNLTKYDRDQSGTIDYRELAFMLFGEYIKPDAEPVRPVKDKDW